MSALFRLRRRWSSLPEPDLDAIGGAHRGEFVGGLLCATAPPGLALMGLPGWTGKRFDGAAGTNLLDGGSEAGPMHAAIGASLLDGRPAIVVTYDASLRPPLRWLRDEFRPLSDTTLLGLMFVTLPGAPKLGIPFLLHRVTQTDRRRADPSP